jgi:chaperonin GroES
MTILFLFARANALVVLHPWPILNFGIGRLRASAEGFMTKKTQFETIEPVGARVLVLKDEPIRETKGGIALPDVAEIPTITGRIVTISRQVEHDEDMPLRQYDKIIFHPKNAIPVDFEPDNQLYVVPVEDVVAVFRKKPAGDET